MVPSSTYRVNYAQSFNMWPESLRRGDIHDICPNAAFFTSIPGFKCEETDSDDDHTDYPPLMISFFDDENINLSDQEIHEKVNFILTNLQCSQEQCNNLEETTRNQAVSQLWYNHRKGRVAGTKAHDVLVNRY